MTESICLEELLAMNRFSSYTIICGRENKSNRLNKVVDDWKQAGTNDLLWLDYKPHTLVEQVQLAVAASINSILITGLPQKTIELKALAEMDFPAKLAIYSLQEKVTLSDVEAAMELVRQLKKSGQFLSFLEAATHQMALKVNEIGMDSYIYQFEKRTRHQLFVTDDQFRCIFDNALALASEKKRILAQIKRAYFESEVPMPDSHLVEVIYDEQQSVCTIYKLINKQQHYGFIILKQKASTISEIDRVQLKCFAPLLIAEFIKRNEAWQIEKKYQYNFIYDLLHNNFDSPSEIINQAKSWGWDFTCPHYFLLMEIENHDKKPFRQEQVDHTIDLLRNTMSFLFYKAIITEINGRLIIIFSDEEEKKRLETKADIKELAESLAQKVTSKIAGTEVSIGIGRHHRSIMDLCRSYQEAKTALALKQLIYDRSIVTHFDDLGIIKLLASLRGELLEEFCDQYLGKLLQYDRQNELELTETLQIYLKENGNLKATADQLFIHINTLRNRLKKIESILNIDLQKSDDFLNIHVALKIHATKAL